MIWNSLRERFYAIGKLVKHLHEVLTGHRAFICIPRAYKALTGKAHTHKANIALAEYVRHYVQSVQSIHKAMTVYVCIQSMHLKLKVFAACIQ